MQHAASGSSSFEHGLERALVFANQLKDLDDRFHHMYPHVSVQFDDLKALPRSYLAPEPFTREWSVLIQGCADAIDDDARVEEKREANPPRWKPNQRQISPRPSPSSRANAALQVFLQNLLPHQRYVTMPKRLPQ